MKKLFLLLISLIILQSGFSQLDLRKRGLFADTIGARGTNFYLPGAAHFLGPVFLRTSPSYALHLGTYAILYEFGSDLYFHDGVAGTKKLSDLISGSSSYFTYSVPNLYPSNTSDNLLVGANSNPSGYKLYVIGASYISGNLTSSNLSTNGNGASFGTLAGSPLLQSTFIGSQAGKNYTGVSSQNTALGHNAIGSGLLTGSYNTSLGASSGVNISSGAYNTITGSGAGGNVTTGSYNTIFGHNAGQSISTTDGNVFIGNEAGYNETGSNKLYISNTYTSLPLIYGSFSSGSYLRFNATDSIAFAGDLYLRKATTPKIYFGQNWIGMAAVNDFKMSVGSQEAIRLVYVGTKHKIYLAGDSLFWNNGPLPTGSSSLIGVTNSMSPYNTFLGYDAGNTGNTNVMVGYYAGHLTTGTYNTFVGPGTGAVNTSGLGNTFLGRNAGTSNTTAYFNTFTGSDAGELNTLGTQNTYNGSYAGYSNNTGTNNVFMGFSAGQNLSGHSFNVFIGSLTGALATAVDSSLFMGANSGFNATTGSNNSFFGTSAGYSITTGSTNVMMGGQAGFSNKTGSGNVMLGYKAGYSETGSNKLYVANSNTATPIIYGDFNTKYLKLYADSVYVQGFIRSDSFMALSHTTYADFVFEKKYTLPAFDEYMSKVWIKKSLPMLADHNRNISRRLESSVEAIEVNYRYDELRERRIEQLERENTVLKSRLDKIESLINKK